MTTLPHQHGHANDPTLETAQIYARAGARVMPLRPKSKMPLITGWPEKATTDLNDLQQWFGNGAANNIGLAMGTWAHTKTDGTYLVCVDIDTADGKNGLENWQQLVADNGGDIGQPFIAETATGGLHLLYVCPIPLTNETGALPEHIDIRGQGGYIMAEPSTHPDNGRKPKWINANWPGAKPGPMPQWLFDIIQTKPEPIQRTATTEPRLRAVGDAPRPGDIYNANNTWETVLTKHGWTFNGEKTDGHGRKSVWVRPGKSATRETQSAVLAHDEGEHGVLTIFSANAPHELRRPDHTTTTGGHYKITNPFDFFACMHHDGDHKQAAQVYGAQLRAEQQRETDALMLANKKPQLSVVAADKKTDATTPETDAPEPGHTWVMREMSELIGVPYEPRMPDLLIMENGRGLLYSNAHNLISGPSGVMKTWLQAYNIVQQIRLGKHCVVIDYEMQMHDWFNRLRSLGATDAELKLVHYCAPDEALQMTLAYGAQGTTKALEKMQAEIVRISDMQGGLALVVIDGVTNAMTQNNLKLLDNQDTARFWQLLPNAIVRLTGAGVVLNDHQAKGTSDNPTPLGAQHKLANTSGAGHMLRPVKFLARWPIFSDGIVVFKCNKDRYGQIGQGLEVAQAVFTPLENEQIDARIETYTGEHEVRQSNTENKIWETVKQINQTGQACSTRAVHKIMGGNRTALGDKILVMVGKQMLRNNGTDEKPNWFAIDNTPDPELF